MVCTRVEPAIFEKGMIPGADLEGGGVPEGIKLGEQSLILNLYPPPSETFYVSNGVFLRENEPVLLNFSWRGPQTPSLLLIFHSVLTVCWKKRRN